jgi:hypothetical protein
VYVQGLVHHLPEEIYMSMCVCVSEYVDGQDLSYR